MPLHSCTKIMSPTTRLNVQIAIAPFGTRSDRFLPLPILQQCVISAIARKSIWDQENYTAGVEELEFRTPPALCLQRILTVSHAIEKEKRAKLRSILRSLWKGRLAKFVWIAMGGG